MKKKTPYLDFYKKCLTDGYIPDRGLCFTFPAVKIFTPLQYEDAYPCYRDGDEASWYWGGDGEKNGNDSVHKFTPLRQTIVLFLAAMNNEL